MGKMLVWGKGGVEGEGGVTEEFVADAHSLVKLLSADDDAVDEGEEGRSELARRSFS